MTSIAKGISERHGYRAAAVIGDRAPPEFRSRLAAVDVELHVVRGLRRRCTPPGFLRLLSTLRGLRPGLLHVHCTDQGGGIAPLAAAWLLRDPTVATLHLVSPGRKRW